MDEILQQIADCIEFGKVNLASPYPPDRRGQEGADEYTKRALEMGVSPQEILNRSLILGMSRIGAKFKENKVFVPQVLMSAKAMNTAMLHLKPFFISGEVQRKGVFILGTVEGDLHDIGKNLVAMMVEGNGFEVIDLGVDVKADKFVKALSDHPGAFVGLSALLTTTMAAMDKTNKLIKSTFPDAKTFVGGAPVSDSFRMEIGADYYSSDPQGLVDILNNLVA